LEKDSKEGTDAMEEQGPVGRDSGKKRAKYDESSRVGPTNWQKSQKKNAGQTVLIL